MNDVVKSTLCLDTLNKLFLIIIARLVKSGVINQQVVRFREGNKYTTRHLITSTVSYEESTIFGIYSPTFFIQTTTMGVIKFNLCTTLTSALMTKNYYSIEQSQVNYAGVVISDSIKHYVDLEFLYEVEKIFIDKHGGYTKEEIVDHIELKIRSMSRLLYALAGEVEKLYASKKPTVTTETLKEEVASYTLVPLSLKELSFDVEFTEDEEIDNFITEDINTTEKLEASINQEILPSELKQQYMELKKKVDRTTKKISRYLTERHSVLQFFKILAFLKKSENQGFTLSHKLDFRGRVYCSSPLSVINTKFLRHVYTYGTYTEDELCKLEQGLHNTVAFKLLEPHLKQININYSNNFRILAKTSMAWLLIELGKLNKSQLLEGAVIRLEQFLKQGLKELNTNALNFKSKN